MDKFSLYSDSIDCGFETIDKELIDMLKNLYFI